MLNDLEVTGRTRTHIVQMEAPRFAAQPAVAEAFLRMRETALVEGIDIQPFSTFRDYKTQLRIWNNKYRGDKTLYDRDGHPRDFSALSEEQIIWHILDWSALPGASRHQWGTEIDVVDAASVSEGYVPQLLPEETREGGVFHRLHQWLDAHIAEFGFFRPYKRYLGGMFEEPWHLSYQAASELAIRSVTIDLLKEVTLEADILGKSKVIDLIPEIYEKHVLNYVGPDEQ